MVKGGIVRIFFNNMKGEADSKHRVNENGPTEGVGAD